MRTRIDLAMKKRFFWMTPITFFMLASCTPHDSSARVSPESIHTTSNMKTEQSTHESGEKSFKSVNDYIHNTMAQQFSFLSFTKRLEKNELILTVTFSVDNILGPQLQSTEQEFYWSIHMSPALSEEIIQPAAPVAFKSIAPDELTTSEQMKSPYTNYYRVEQRFKFPETQFLNIKNKFTTAKFEYIFSLHDEHQEEVYNFFDLESFVHEY